MSQKMNWRDRVKELRRVPASELKANPKNWREHPDDQRKALGGVLDEVGIAGALIARETDDGLELIDGHLRTDMDDATEWPVLILDVDEAEADILLATLDPIGALASSNAKALEELLDGIEVDNAALTSMLEELKQPSQWKEPDDLSGISNYDPDAETVVLKIEVPMKKSGEVSEVLRTAMNDQGWSYEVGSF